MQTVSVLWKSECMCVALFSVGLLVKSIGGQQQRRAAVLKKKSMKRLDIVLLFTKKTKKVLKNVSVPTIQLFLLDFYESFMSYFC